MWLSGGKEFQSLWINLNYYSHDPKYIRYFQSTFTKFPLTVCMYAICITVSSDKVMLRTKRRNPTSTVQKNPHTKQLHVLAFLLGWLAKNNPVVITFLEPVPICKKRKIGFNLSSLFFRNSSFTSTRKGFKKNNFCVSISAICLLMEITTTTIPLRTSSISTTTILLWYFQISLPCVGLASLCKYKRRNARKTLTTAHKMYLY